MNRLIVVDNFDACGTCNENFRILEIIRTNNETTIRKSSGRIDNIHESGNLVMDFAKGNALICTKI